MRGTLHPDAGGLCCPGLDAAQRSQGGLSLPFLGGGAEGTKAFERQALAEITQHRALELLGQRDVHVSG
jgi:hypothetical protein